MYVAKKGKVARETSPLRFKLINLLSLGILENGSEAKKFRATPQ